MQLLTKKWADVFRLAGVTVIAAGAAGCSGDFSRLASGSFFSTDNQRSIMGDGAPTTTGSVAPGPASLPPATAASYASAAQPATGPAVTYKGWTSAGGSVITVRQGDTLAAISRRYGVPPEAILATSRMTAAAQVVPGAQVVIPVYSTAAATSVGAAPATGAAPGGSTTHKVTPGQTLLSISRTYGVPSQAIMQANNLTDANQIRIGQVLRIPGGAPANTQLASLPTTLNDAAAKMPEARPTPPPASTLTQAPAAATPAAGTPAAPGTPAGGMQVASLPDLAAGAGKTATDAAPAEAEAAPTEEDTGSGFRWPARGRIISGFGRKSNGEQNDGINIALPEGAPVKAAEAGVVIYAGNELTGFGNLILIRHDNGWVTAYAHNKDVLVTRNEQIKRGQVIGHAGTTGNVSQPQLHFELRKGSQPVDPLPHLSGA